MKKAIVAMSGGVDSSVTAYLLREAGYEVTGVTMRLFDPAELPTNNNQSEPLSASANDIYADVQAVARKLGIDCSLYDMRDEFRRDVMQSFVQAYERGETPNPCIECNKRLKFESLYNRALSDYSDSDQDFVLTTGHYARIEHDSQSDRFTLRKASDLSKDQSYVLYNMTQEQLARTLFPLGSLTKEEVRDIAESQGLVNARKKDSQDICFIPDGDYGRFIRHFTGRDYPPGDFVDLDGNVMGEHKGIIEYTIGQRKGLGLALKKPAYVQRLDIASNRVILGDNADLFKCELIADNWNWVSIPPQAEEFRALARIRYKHRESPAAIVPLPGGSVKVVFDEPQRAITSGQSVVLYGGRGGEYVLGGGIIRG